MQINRLGFEEERLWRTSFRSRFMCTSAVLVVGPPLKATVFMEDNLSHNRDADKIKVRCGR